MKNKMKLLVGFLFATMLAVGAISAHAKITKEGSSETVKGTDISATRKCPPFCV